MNNILCTLERYNCVDYCADLCTRRIICIRFNISESIVSKYCYYAYSFLNTRYYLKSQFFRQLIVAIGCTNITGTDFFYILCYDLVNRIFYFVIIKI